MSAPLIACVRWMLSWQRTAEPLVVGRIRADRVFGRSGGPCRGRCKYVPVSSMAPSMAPTPLHGPPARPLTVSVGVQPRKRKKKSKSGSRRYARSGVDQGRHPPHARHVDTHQQQCSTQSRQIAGICRRRDGSGCGGVSAMDGAIEATGTYLRRPPQPEPPRHPTDSQLLTLTLLRLRLRRVQGAALQSKPHPQ